MKPKLPESPPYQKPKARRQRVITKKELDSRYYSDRVIAPLAAWVDAHRGAAVEVTRRVSSFLGKKINRQQVARWIAMDPDKRVEPTFGNGLVLVRVIRTMRSEYMAGIAPPHTTGPLQVDPSLVTPDEDDLPSEEPDQEVVPLPSPPDQDKKPVRFMLKGGRKRTG